MNLNDLRNITSSAVAPFLRRLRSGTSRQTRLFSGEEVLPHHYGTDKKDPPYGATESLYGETHADSRATAPTAWARCLRYFRATRQQLGPAPGIARLRRAATAIMGLLRALSVRRAGDRAWQSVGEEAGRVGVAFSHSVCFTRNNSSDSLRCAVTQSVHFFYDKVGLLSTVLFSRLGTALEYRAPNLNGSGSHLRFYYCGSLSISIHRAVHPHVRGAHG